MREENKPLFKAIKAGHLDDVAAFINQGIDINKDFEGCGGTALGFAISCLNKLNDSSKKTSYIKIITLLIQHQAVLCNEKVSPYVYVNILDQTQTKYPEIKPILSEAKIAPRPETLLAFAELGNTSFVERLLALSVDPNFKFAGFGGTILYHTVMRLSKIDAKDSKKHNYLATIWLLIKKGALLSHAHEYNKDSTLKMFNQTMELHPEILFFPIQENEQLPEVLNKIICEYYFFSPPATTTSNQSKTSPSMSLK